VTADSDAKRRGWIGSLLAGAATFALGVGLIAYEVARLPMSRAELQTSFAAMQAMVCLGGLLGMLGTAIAAAAIVRAARRS
jgi:hypothetical protein